MESLAEGHPVGNRQSGTEAILKPGAYEPTIQVFNHLLCGSGYELGSSLWLGKAGSEHTHYDSWPSTSGPSKVLLGSP